jgi:hypothetical protein
MNSKKNFPYEGTPTIDSLRLSYPLLNVQIIDEAILSKVVHQQTTRTDTGEVIEESFTESNSQLLYFEESPTYSIKVRIESWFGGQQKLCILLNSKVLEGGYLQGISIDNIERIYNRLNGKVFNMSFEQFLLGKPTDIDIKKDVYVESIEDFDLFTLEMKQQSRHRKEKGLGVNRFSKKTNKGIEWNNREHSTEANPFLKIYHKGTEAKHGKNSDFFSKHLSQYDLDKVARIEVTVKNSKEAKKLGIDNSTLLTLLSTSKEQFNEVIVKAIKRNLLEHKPQLKKQTNTKDLTGHNKLIFIHLSNMISNQKYTFNEALEWTLSQYFDTQDRYRMKKKITAIYEAHIQGQDFNVRTLKKSQFFKSIGWE